MSAEIIEIHHALEQGKAVVVTTIINSRGSTPRSAGSKMIVYEDGGTSGTIGGGVIEGNVIERALTLFKTRNAMITSHDLHQSGESDELDLTCGGHLEVLLEYIAPCRDNEMLYGAAFQKINREQPFLWKTAIKELHGSIAVEQSIHEITGTDTGNYLKPSTQKSDDSLVLIEPVLPNQTVYIVGAGHVSREIAKLTKQVGLRTLVFDDRAAFANASRFPEADGIHVCMDYAGIFEPYDITQNSYIIIVTRGHSFDKEVLSQALKTRAGYIGMMGSRRKRNTIYEALIAEGYDLKELDTVHCPIGLPIKAETPAELAVSIIAELINHRASSTIHG